MAINLDLVLAAKNLTGQAFQSFQNSINTTNRLVGSFRTNLSGVRSAIADFRQIQTSAGEQGVTSMGALNTGLLTVLGTVGLVTAAFGQLQKATGSALDAQFQRVTDISTLQQVLGTSVKESARLTDLSRKQIAQYGINLPISTEDVRSAYSLVIDDYAAALKGKLSNEKILGVTTSDAARLGVLRGSLSDSGKAAFQSNISSILSGQTGIGSINTLAIGQNVQFKNAFIEELKKRNVQNLGQLNPASKIQAFSAILEKVITADQIKLLQGTGKAQISAITDKLFNPDVGLFSFARNLGKEGGERKTVVDEATKTLDLLFGDKGLITMLGKIGAFGKGDPIVPFYDAVRAVNSYLEDVNTTVAKLKSVSPALAGSMIGKGLADLTNAAVDGILGAVASIDWGGVVIGIGAGIGSFFANLDWKVYLIGTVGLIGAALIPELVAGAVLYGGTILALIGTVVSGGTLLIAGAIGLGLVAIGKLIVDNWEPIKQKAIAAGNAIDGTFNNIVEGTGNFIQKAWAGTVSTYTRFTDYAIDAIGSFLRNAIKGTTDFFSSIKDAISAIFTTVSDTINSIIQAIKALLDSVLQPIESGISGLTGSVSSAFSSVSNALNPSNITGAIGGAINSVTSTASNVTGSVLSFFGARYMGNIPALSAAGGLMDAILTESVKKPASAGLVVANSSELILPQSQILPFLSANGRNTTINVGGITLAIPGGTAVEIAEQAIAIIESRLAAELEAAL